jgi:cell wall-associated NlpC family hydrolase
MKKKNKLVSISSAIVLTLAGCAASAANASVVENVSAPIVIASKAKAVKHPHPLMGTLTKNKTAQTMLEKHALHVKKLMTNQVKIKAALKKVTKYAGKTWYVFSGSSPRGWDCSGLVRWTYEQVGVELEHRANAQANSGKKVKHPIPGDVVAFYHKGSERSFHVGVYLGKGKMIHSYRLGMRTVIQPVKEVVKENWGARVTYTRILPQPQN